MAKGEKVLGVIGGVLAAAVGVAKIVSAFIGRGDDLGCDWYCDNCGANLNTQLGFSAGDTWICRECGYENDVSTDNIRQTYFADDGFGNEIEVLDLPSPGDWEDPEDY